MTVEGRTQAVRKQIIPSCSKILDFKQEFTHGWVSFSAPKPPSPTSKASNVSNCLDNPLAQSRKVMCSSASGSMLTTSNVSWVLQLTPEQLTCTAWAVSASAAPVSSGCWQAGPGKQRKLHQLHRAEFCRGGWERREKFNRNSSSTSRLKIKLYHKEQCDQAQLTDFFFGLYLSTLDLHWRGI